MNTLTREHRNCLVPIDPWLATKRRRNGQQVLNEVTTENEVWTCSCGKVWSKRDEYGGRTLVGRRVED